MARHHNRREHKLTTIREFLKKWIEVPEMYNPTENVTVDEKLVGFRRQCSFKKFMPCISAQCGIEIWTFSDTATSYILKSQMYTGRVKYVLRLCIQVNKSELYMG